MAVLSKAGCNQGVCHGNRSGKGGFLLSLRGQDPERDWLSLTREHAGRRLDPQRPDASLILLKPTVQLPHEGGQRFPQGSLEHEVLRRWIAAGAPIDTRDAPRLERLEVAPADALVVDPVTEIDLKVWARYSNGERRDVTSLAVYEPVSQRVRVSAEGRVTRLEPGEATVLVRFLHLQVPARQTFFAADRGFAWKDAPAENFIDEHVFAKLKRLRIQPSDLASDAVFLRRAFLDLLGILPSAAEARSFVSDPDPRKREKAVGRLLERPEFADFWALKWSDLLRNEEKVLDRKGVQNFHHWIRQSLAQGKPLDVFARELIAARGSTYRNPPANYYRSGRDPLTRAETTAQVFLGLRLGCAKCHNHPFDRWTQDDYYGWAAFFSRVEYKVIENRRRDQNDSHEFDGEQVVWMRGQGEVNDPRTGQPVPPRFLGDASSPPSDADRLEALAEWVAHPENPFFARSLANRVWFHLMGRGIVEPADDFRATNPPSHPELLDALARDLAEGGFDLRRLIRRIMASRTYQLSSVPNATNAGDEENFSRALVRRLGAEQLLDGASQVTGAEVSFNGYPEGLRASQVPGVLAVRLREKPPALGDQFLRLFGKPPRLIACECERSEESTLGQAFQLLSGPVLNKLLTEPENRLGALLESKKTAAEVVEELYWTALTRAPSGAEIEAAVRHLDEQGKDRRGALEDLAWSLINSKEFLLRH
jgi:hypothetical protein